MKLKTIYVCTSCKQQNSKWSGQCSECKAWNSIVEDVINIGKSNKKLSSTPRLIQNAEPLKKHINTQKKISSEIEEFDRVIGDGILAGSITLLSGEPGIGKSTLTLQIASNISQKEKTLIISGEESINQIADRAERLKLKYKDILAVNSFNLEEILEIIKRENAKFVIIDSIQVISSSDIESAAGSVSQVRYCTERIMDLVKNTNVAVILIGHVTKEGNLAGPRTLEHLVDTVMHIEGDRFQQLRILRAVKNRFGSCSEVGIFEMKENGLQEVKNPSEQLLEGRKENAVGSAITITMEGTRPLLVEVQALVSTTHFGYPKRTSNGFDMSRLQILIAALEKYGKLNLQNQDIYINVIGGIKLKEPSADLAILMAIASSLIKKPLPSNAIIFGEVGLSGELRKVSHNQRRIKEANKLGFNRIANPDNISEIQKALQIFQ